LGSHLLAEAGAPSRRAHRHRAALAWRWDLNRVLKFQQGFQKGPEIHRGLKRALENAQAGPHQRRVAGTERRPPAPRRSYPRGRPACTPPRPSPACGCAPKAPRFVYRGVNTRPGVASAYVEWRFACERTGSKREPGVTCASISPAAGSSRGSAWRRSTAPWCTWRSGPAAPSASAPARRACAATPRQRSRESEWRGGLEQSRRLRALGT
jgi:hypothetical protein